MVEGYGDGIIKGDFIEKNVMMLVMLEWIYMYIIYFWVCF